MPVYRRKTPAAARQVTDPVVYLSLWCGGATGSDSGGRFVLVRTKDEPTRAYPGDWIVNEDGEWRVYASDDFHRIYETEKSPPPLTPADQVAVDDARRLAAAWEDDRYVSGRALVQCLRALLAIIGRLTPATTNWNGDR